MELKEVKRLNLYTAAQVIDFMKISRLTLYRMIKNGKINAINVAKSGKRPIFAFRAEDVQAYYDTFGASGKNGARSADGDPKAPHSLTDIRVPE